MGSTISPRASLKRRGGGETLVNSDQLSFRRGIGKSSHFSWRLIESTNEFNR
ncbi:hypothetical protein ALC56_03343 [Trachymyrmex septentrionalis]|uniref:Uncharacterized protein n=1 Tax=Trachymyrmex septentrionalis TaxID=34720 RepID=A0A195FNT0_9HYME|nr:hypothetical protein ALC56_03343 [Trachymyrmex septentrionalis]